MLRPDIDLGFNASQPVACIEQRESLPGQHITRQTHLARRLAEHGIGMVMVDPLAPETYTKDGLIVQYHVYDDADQPKVSRTVCLPSGYGMIPHAWRQRDSVRDGGDPVAHNPVQGFNSQDMRVGLASRDRVLQVVQAIDSRLVVPSIVVDPHSNRHALAELPEGKEFFVKPLAVSDIAESSPADRSRRAVLVAREAVRETLAAVYEGKAVIQQRLPLMPAQTIISLLGIERPSNAPDLDSQYTHAIRVYQALWFTPTKDKPVVAAAVELRLNHIDNVGARFASESHLVNPEELLYVLPGLNAIHTFVMRRLGQQFCKNGSPGGFPALDYLLSPSGEVHIAGILCRPLSPSLEEHQHPVQLARARRTADVEANQLARIARRHSANPFIIKTAT